MFDAESAPLMNPPDVVQTASGIAPAGAFTVAGVVTPLLVSVGLLCIGAAAAGVEASLLAMPEARLRALRDELGAAGRPLDTYLADPGRTLSSLLAGRVFAPIASMAVATAALARGRAPQWWEVTLIVIVVAGVYGTLAEIAITMGRRRAWSVVPGALSYIRPLAWLLIPVAAPLAAAGRWAAARITDGATVEPPTVTGKEVEYVVEQAQNSGAVDPLSSEMLQNVFSLKDHVARDIMVPRTQMVAMEINTPLPEALRRMNNEGHSRVPVYRGQIDNVVGVVFAKDLYREVTTAMSVVPPGDTPAPPRRSLDAIVRRPAAFVADSQPLLSVLRDMQTRRVHLAIVSDEFGAVAGLVTLEDILEVLVGEIHDEHYEDDDRFVEVTHDRWLVSAAMSVDDVGEKLSVEFPPGEDYASLGGFLAAKAGKVPHVGTVVVWEGLRFVVREGDKRKAIKVEITRLAPTPTPTEKQS